MSLVPMVPLWLNKKKLVGAHFGIRCMPDLHICVMDQTLVSVNVLHKSMGHGMGTYSCSSKLRNSRKLAQNSDCVASVTKV